MPTKYPHILPRVGLPPYIWRPNPTIETTVDQALTMMVFFPIRAKAFPRLASSRPLTLAIFAARRPIITTPPPLLLGERTANC